MPINSQCPTCKAVFSLDKSYLGQMVVCPKCNTQYQVTATPLGKPKKRKEKPVAAPTIQTQGSPTPSQSIPPVPPPISTADAPQAAARPVSPTGLDGVAAAKASRRVSGGGAISRFTDVNFGGSPFRRQLWLGLLLFIAAFAIKQMIVNYGLVRTNSATELARVSLARAAERESVNYRVSELQREINELQFEGRIDGEDLRKKRDELNKLNESNRERLSEINKKYSKLQSDAQRNATAAAATSFRLLKWTWWFKLLLDMGKIAGCFLVLHAAFRLVCQADEDAQVKTFATVCAGIVLTAILVTNLTTMMG